LQSTKNYTSSVATKVTLENTIRLADTTSSLYDKLIYILDNTITSNSFTQAQLDAIK